MVPPPKWCILPLFLIFVIHLRILEADPVEEIFDAVASCLKYDGLLKDRPKFPVCLSRDKDEVSEGCIQEIFVWVRSREEEFVRTLEGKSEGHAAPDDKDVGRMEDILDSEIVVSVIKEVRASRTALGKAELGCSVNCNSRVVGVLRSLETPSEIVNSIQSFLCSSKSFTMETCVESVETSIEDFLDRDNKKAENIERSTALKICYNVGLAFGRSPIFLSHAFDLLGLDLSIQEQLGVTISQLTGKSLGQLSLDPGIIYILDSILQIRIKETYFMETRDRSRTGKDVLDADFGGATGGQLVAHSFSECQFGVDLLLKIYLLPTQRSEQLCRIFFLYRGVDLHEEPPKDERRAGLGQIPEMVDARKALRALVESSLGSFDAKKWTKILRLSRFRLFDCFETLLNRNLKLEIPVVSGTCYFIYRGVKKDFAELFDISTAYFVPLTLTWLSQKARSDLFPDTGTSEGAIYTTAFGRSVTYSLLQSMNDGFDLNECKRHIQLLSDHEPFLSQKYPSSPSFPLSRMVIPSPIDRELVHLICNEKSLVFQMFSRINPLREFVPETLPTKVTYKVCGSSVEDSKGAQNSLMGTKDIFDAVLQLHFAGDVPRGYLMNAVSFSIVGLKAFLRNTLTFLSQEIIMSRYDDIQKGKAIITPFSDALTLMGISGSYNNQMDAQEQLVFTNKYICNGSSENISLRINNANIVKFVGSPFYLVAKDSKNSPKNMFNFVNCVDEFILINWNNARYSLLKSDPILFCSLIGIYLARDHDFIQSEVSKYAIYVTYYETTGNVLPEKCMEVNFSSIPYIKEIEDRDILSRAFIDCVKKYSALTDIVSNSELTSLSESFSKGVLQYVDKPMSLHSSSMYGRLLTYVLERHPKIGKERAKMIIMSLSPIYGFNYGQLISRLMENNLPLKESAVIAGFIGNKLDGNTKKLDFDFINWLGNYSNCYLPLDNHVGLKENLLKLFSGKEPLKNSDCIQKVRELFDRFQVPVDTSTESICEEWGSLFDNYPRKNSYTKFASMMSQSSESTTKGSQKDTINLRITRTNPVGISTKVSISLRGTPLISLIPVLVNKGFLDPKKETLEGFQVESRTIILVGQENEMEVSAETVGLNDGDILYLIVRDLEPQIFDIHVSWKDSNTRNEGSFLFSTKDVPLGQFFEDLQKREELKERIIKHLLLPNGKMLDPQSGNSDQMISKYGLGTSDKVELSTLLKNISFLNLRLVWRNPSVLEVVPSIENEDNMGESFMSKEIQISSNENLRNLFEEIKIALMEAVFSGGDRFGVEKFEVVSIEILGDAQKGVFQTLDVVQRIIQNGPETHSLLISDAGILNHDRVLVNLGIEPFRTVNIISKAQKLSYVAKITSIPHNLRKEPEPRYGLFYILNVVLESNIDLYEVMVHEKYFIDKEPKGKRVKGHYIDIFQEIKTFDSVGKLVQNSIVLLNSRKLAKSGLISLVVILKDVPEISKNIRFQAVTSSSNVYELLKRNFGSHIKPESLFTKSGKEIKLNGGKTNIIFRDMFLKDGDALYLTCIKPQLDERPDGMEANKYSREISFERVEELLGSYGYIIPGSERGKRDVLDPHGTLGYPRKFNDIAHLEMFVRQLAPSINSERLISESQDLIFQRDYRFPSAFERLLPLLTEDFLGVQADYGVIKDLRETHGLLNGTEGDIFDFLGCIQSFRNFFFYNRPAKEVYSARIYNSCKRIGSLLFRKESWLVEQGITGAFISTLEEELLHPIDTEKEGIYLKNVDCLGLLGPDCIEISASLLSKLNLTSSQAADLEIPTTVANPERICMALQSFVNNYDESTKEYEKVVHVLPAYKLSQTIDSFFPRFWEENTFGALLPSISEMKYAISPLFDFSKAFQFITNYMEIHLDLLKKYPNCYVILAILIIRNIMVGSGIDSLVFARKLAQFALENEHQEKKELGVNIPQVLSALERNPYLLSVKIKYGTGNSWIWDVIKGNQIREIQTLGRKLRYSGRLLLIFNKTEGLCPGLVVADKPAIKLGDDIQALIKYLTRGILVRKTAGVEDQLSEEFKMNDLTLISEKLDPFRGDLFYKIIKEDIIKIIQRNTKEMKKAIGYLDAGSYDHEYVPFVVALGVISSVWENERSKNDFMHSFVRFFVQEIFLNLGIVIGNIEIQHITDEFMGYFDWSRMRIPKKDLLQILGQVCPMNSATFLESGGDSGAIEDIADLIIRVIESRDPIKLNGFRALTTTINPDIGITPRAHFYRSFKDPQSKLEEERIEGINRVLVEREGYPKNMLSSFNSHIREAVRILNSEIIHVGRLGKMVLSSRQEHIGAIFLSYGYLNIQPSTLLNNFDHIHCFSSVLGIIGDEPKRLDHYYQICMSICIEVEEISYHSCEELLIQSITLTLLSEEKPQPLKRLISFLKYDYVFEHDLDVLREIYLDEGSKRLSEKWLGLIRSMKHFFGFYSIVSQFKPHVEQILLEKNIKEPSSGFGLIDLLGELVSCWTRESGEDYIKKFLISGRYPMELIKPFSAIWPGDGRNRVNLRISVPGKGTLRRLRTSLRHEMQTKGLYKQGSSESLIDEIIERMADSVLGFNIRLVEKIPSSMHKVKNVKMAENGVNIENVISKLGVNSQVSIYLSVNECILETKRQINDHLVLSYSDVLMFCLGIVSEMCYKKMMTSSNEETSVHFHSYIHMRNELYFVTVFYGFQYALSRIFQGFLSKHKIKEYLLLMKHNLYQLNNQLGILNFVTRFVVNFRLPVDPNVLSYYLKEVILDSNSGISLDKADEIRIYQNVPDVILSSKGFHRLVFEISKGLFDSVGDDLEKNHFKLLFKDKNVRELIERGFSPINIQEFVSKITNKSHKEVLIEFGKKLGMNSLSFKLVYVHKMVLSRILEILKENRVSSTQRQFFTTIGSNLSPMDEFIYELIYTSKENCVVEMIHRYVTSTRQISSGPEFEYAFRFCDELLVPLEAMTQKIDDAFGPDYFGGLASCDHARINKETDRLKSEISNTLNYLNNLELITSLFEMKKSKDLRLEKSIRHVEKKIEKKYFAKYKILRLQSKWDKPIYKKILLEIKYRKNVFNTIMSYLDNHVFIVVPMFRKISNAYRKDIDIMEYQMVKKTLSKLILTLATVKDPYSIPSVVKSNAKIKAEYLRETSKHKAKISLQESKEIHILGVNLLPYYLKICWYSYYLSTVVEEINILLNQLPAFTLPSVDKSKKKRTSISRFLPKSRKTSDKVKSEIFSQSEGGTRDHADHKPKKRTKGFNIFKRINGFFKKKRMKSQNL